MPAYSLNDSDILRGRLLRRLACSRLEMTCADKDVLNAIACWIDARYANDHSAVVTVIPESVWQLAQVSESTYFNCLLRLEAMGLIARGTRRMNGLTISKAIEIFMPPDVDLAEALRARHAQNIPEPTLFETPASRSNSGAPESGPSNFTPAGRSNSGAPESGPSHFTPASRSNSGAPESEPAHFTPASRSNSGQPECASIKSNDSVVVVDVLNTTTATANAEEENRVSVLRKMLIAKAKLPFAIADREARLPTCNLDRVTNLLAQQAECRRINKPPKDPVRWAVTCLRADPPWALPMTPEQRRIERLPAAQAEDLAGSRHRQGVDLADIARSEAELRKLPPAELEALRARAIELNENPRVKDRWREATDPLNQSSLRQAMIGIYRANQTMQNT